ncbi:hypothetical protein BJ138DRAFT_601968 [Hygrophoropsis aurantiaca]|uniref:Uncharacterized protein n=1 Tax=Hygrophoropsis aurantiaca TaxID=72124 RepID=A0ACB8ASV5_9AGAM|nr:hypothetical protein BJ138DRAFT_601968 [Hygrophoropsis aurantiaca]
MPCSRPTSPHSPSSPKYQRKPIILPGFRAPPKPKAKLVSQMTVRELHDQHDRNTKLLSSPSASTSALVQRLSTEQAVIESRLMELEDVEEIRKKLNKTNINADEIMSVDDTPAPRVIDAKQRALSRYAPISTNGSSHVGSLSLQEAVELERRAHAQDLERQQRADDRKRRLGLPLKGEVLTRQEMEARMWAFMNYKPTDSDLEDMDDDDDSDEDPSTWFEDDQEDGVKGQDIIEPDEEDLSNIIRIDENRLAYSTFYEPRGEGD